jgi:hypothetical protein
MDMSCYLSGAFGLAMLGASFYTMTVSRKQHDELTKLFSEDLVNKYEKIVKERSYHYIQGIVIGIVASYLILQRMNIANTFHRNSIFFGISLTVGVVYYMLMPKSDFMLNHLRTDEQKKAWVNVYQTMKQRYFFGFVLGALASIPFSNILC